MRAAVLRHSEAVAHAGSIRKAAEQLDAAASAINRQIRNLEDRLGATLSVIAAPLAETASPRSGSGSCCPADFAPLVRTRR